MTGNATLGGKGRPRKAYVRGLIAVIAVLLVTACAGKPSRQIETLRRDDGGKAVILLMPLDVELYEVSAGGALEPKADWTEAARKHLTTAIRDRLAATNTGTLEFHSPPDNTPEAHDLHQLIALHGAVGATIQLHHFVEPAKLPTKDGRFDWSLGPKAAALRDHYPADYALFIHVRDSYASAGRVAFIVVAAAFGVGVPGGQQLGFASLVDLRTGDVVWSNRLIRGDGDLRTLEPAKAAAEVMLTHMPQ